MDPGHYPDESRAEALLAERGIRASSVQWLLGQPRGAFWTVRWVVWMEAKRGLHKPADFLYTRIRGALTGKPDCQVPPDAWLDGFEKRAHEQKQRERTASKLNPPATPSGAPREQFLAAARRESTFLHSLLTRAGCHLEDTGAELVFAPTPTHLSTARRERDVLVRIARQCGREFRLVEKGVPDA